jgi:hypothetical protein
LKRKHVQTGKSYQLAGKQEPSTTNRQIEREDCDLFWEVIQKYGSIVFPDPQANGKQNRTALIRKRTPASAGFLKRVESATNCALQGTSLIDDWIRLAQNDNRPKSGVTQQIIDLCALVYRERGLSLDPCFTTSGRTGERVRRPRTKSIWNQTHYSHSKVGRSRYYCEQHGLQTVTNSFKDDAGEILKLQCGCKRRMDVDAAVPVRGTVVSIDELPAAASHSTRDATTMSGWFGGAA